MFFLSRGDITAIFALLGKTPFDMLLSVAFDNRAAKTPAVKCYQILLKMALKEIFSVNYQELGR